MKEQFVETEQIGHVLVITLNRPKVNAISRALSRAIHAAAEHLQTDPNLRVGVITAKGDRVFSAGWDFRDSVQQDAETGDRDFDMTHGPGGFAGITRYWDLKKPLIAAVNGAAIGGGFEIALAADVIIAAENAYFELPEMQRGFLPDAGGVQRLPRRIPYNVAMEMILSGRRMSAAEAKGWGLVHDVVPQAKLGETAVTLATQIAKGAPLALQALKEVMQVIDHLPVQEAIQVTRAPDARMPIFQRMWTSEDAKEGPRAFLERREPVWRGR
ncbi:enoyl-CoA hydratase-related protein [Dongia soli]|uniref:Enoyl-CoA hydratase-related protein n=1 Tax=Dongia soli TaxID=600628 RepID=A0ABU5ED67_9PROT|nr:enoyl-CoA hydratase-related protein [Dongia soli]MDY0883764.1 enoyl-CoA hydratase-related protein [Dongia soli]